MAVDIVVVMDGPETVDPDTDTSFALILAARERDHRVWHCHTPAVRFGACRLAMSLTSLTPALPGGEGTMSEKASRRSWGVEPLTSPRPIPAPSRIWSNDEMAAIRLGYIPIFMEEKWFIFMEGNRLFCHRSWTGDGIFEATFAPTDGGYIIESAVVTDDENKWPHHSNETETNTLESLIIHKLLKEP